MIFNKSRILIKICITTIKHLQLWTRIKKLIFYYWFWEFVSLQQASYYLHSEELETILQQGLLMV